MSGRDRAWRTGFMTALGLWACLPLVLMGVHALSSGDSLTGADGIIGSDQLQYLAWARDAGMHGLASNLFELRAGAHVYAHPLFTITGALWRLGLPMVLAYWLWKPVAVAVLSLGAWAWCRRMFPASRFSGLAALVLCLFLYTPAASLSQAANLGSSTTRDAVGALAGEMFSAGELWGYLPSAIAIGLMPLVLLACQRGLEHSARALRFGLLAGLGAVLVSWLHPWQGVTLLLMLIALWIWGPRRGRLILALPAAGAAVPLAYYELLAQLDPAWRLASSNELVPRLPLVALIVGLGPLLLLAAAGIRRPGSELTERALLLWIPATLVTYAVIGAFPAHALEGITIPIAVLMVRGWNGLPSRRWSRLAGAVAVALISLPGLVYESRSLHEAVTGPLRTTYYMNPEDARALKWVATKAPPGGVLARTIFAVGIPSITDRHVWVGHEFWSQSWLVRARQADALFSGALPELGARALVRRSGARLLVADCATKVDLGSTLRPILQSAHRFGCARVYVIP